MAERAHNLIQASLQGHFKQSKHHLTEEAEILTSSTVTSSLLLGPHDVVGAFDQGVC